MFSLVTTCLNEYESLSQWRQDLEGQTRLPDEVVIVDAESTDGTYEALLQWAATDARIRVYQQKCSVAAGRNLAIENASHPIIISTDMGVRLHPKWVEAITQPFADDPTVDVVMGNYEADRNSIKSSASRAEFFISGTGSAFVTDVTGCVRIKKGIVPGNRSVAYRKSVWKALGGLPSDLSYAADDSVFGRQLQRSDYHIAYAPDALVYWERPQELVRFWKEQRGYGRGDGEAAIKTPIAFRWHALGRLPASLVPWLTGFRWLAKGCTISGLLMAIERFDFLAALYILPLQFGNGYSFGCGYLVGDEYGKANCQACRGRLPDRESQQTMNASNPYSHRV
jgi:cellulose synthase/poly-beta-1,6-N-acetylglucosamine synthase-like glycosyltransferase